MAIYRKKPEFVRAFIWNEDEEAPEWFTKRIKHGCKDVLFPGAVVFQILDDNLGNQVRIMSQRNFYKCYELERVIENWSD